MRRGVVTFHRGLSSKQNQRVTPQYKQTIHAGQKLIIGPVDLSALNSEQVEGRLSKNSMRYWHVLDITRQLYHLAKCPYWLVTTVSFYYL